MLINSTPQLAPLTPPSPALTPNGCTQVESAAHSLCSLLWWRSSICCREERNSARCSARCGGCQTCTLCGQPPTTRRGGGVRGGKVLGSASYLSCSHHPSTLIFAPTFAPTPAHSPTSVRWKNCSSICTGLPRKSVLNNENGNMVSGEGEVPGPGAVLREQRGVGRIIALKLVDLSDIFKWSATSWKTGYIFF